MRNFLRRLFLHDNEAHRQMLVGGARFFLRYIQSIQRGPTLPQLVHKHRSVQIPVRRPLKYTCVIVQRYRVDAGIFTIPIGKIAAWMARGMVSLLAVRFSCSGTCESTAARRGVSIGKNELFVRGFWQCSWGASINWSILYHSDRAVLSTSSNTT